jgi:hypothetical protein
LGGPTTPRPASLCCISMPCDESLPTPTHFFIYRRDRRYKGSISKN